ncbi:MAG: hypothetical protein AB1730_02660 [Myxococcota bacterium]|jgi:hypothetical protein
MSRQVALGGVIGFLLTVILLAVCKKNEPAPPAGAGPIRVEHLQPAQFDQPPRALPAPLPIRQPAPGLPSVARPLNLEGFDAGRR